MASARGVFAIIWLTVGLTLAAQENLPEGKGKHTLENTCTECHGLDKVLSKPRSEQGWRDIAKEMRSFGATMTDEELTDLIEYLVQNFGASKVNVNKATAKELEAALQLTARESAALVQYREANGPFKEWRDLTKVDGIDKAKIESKKDQLAF